MSANTEPSRLEPALLRELNNIVQEQIKSILSERDRLGDAMERSDRRFAEAMERIDRRFEEAKKEREEAKKEREEAKKENDRRFEEAKKEREEAKKEREEAKKEREEAKKESNEKFTHIITNQKKINGKIDAMLSQFGRGYETHMRYIVKYLIQDIEKTNDISFERADIPIPVDSPFRKVIQSPIAEIDGYSEDPPYLMEATSILRGKEKIEIFLAKKKYVESITGKSFQGYFCVTYCEMDNEAIGELVTMLTENGCNFLNMGHTTSPN